MCESMNTMEKSTKLDNMRRALMKDTKRKDDNNYYVIEAELDITEKGQPYNTSRIKQTFVDEDRANEIYDKYIKEHESTGLRFAVSLSHGALLAGEIVSTCDYYRKNF